MKKILLLLLACMSLNTQAQTPDLLPQVFSPDAAELGKYGKVPVNYFNGLPNITIPLTEVRAKNYTLPVYLSYHASGNKPDQHPGWVGQGWSLHAGGCINRIIRGKKDEMIWKEFDDEMPNHEYFAGNPGYMYHASEVQSTDWNRLELLKCIIPRRYAYDDQQRKYLNYYHYDFEPDEFQINIDDISASFYIVGDGKVKIVSKSDADFTVRWRMNDEARYYNGGRAIDYKFSRQYATVYDTFYEFIVTAKDGTEYYFGGDEDAIEYSIRNTIPEYMCGSENDWQLRATANTWMLTKIARPDGEVIYFNYKRDGVPIVMVDSHSINEEIWPMVPTAQSYNTFNNTIVDETFHHYVKQYGKGDMNISFYFLLPSYLESICCEIGKDEVLFKTRKSVQLDYEYTKDMFNKRNGQYDGSDNGLYDHMVQNNHYEQLESMTFNHGEAHFDYTRDPKTRLKLNSVEIVAKNCEPMIYSMTYDSTPLPKYYSRKTDFWGFYNYHDTNPIIEIIKQKKEYDESVYLKEMMKYEANLTLLKAEMLTKITYPTGGWTSLEYEPHDYCYHICQFPFVAAPLAGKAGGLRIRKISDYSFEDKVEERIFTYTDPVSGRSSGISSGHPIYSIKGELPFLPPDAWIETTLDGYPHSYTGIFRYYHASESMLNQLSDTDGNHVTYSCVTETIPGIEKTEYKYSNHDTFLLGGLRNCMDRSPIITEETYKKNSSFSSMALCRGLLLSKTKISMKGEGSMSEHYTYAQDTTDFIYSVYKYCSDWFTPYQNMVEYIKEHLSWYWDSEIISGENRYVSPYHEWLPTDPSFSDYIYSGAVSKIYTFFPKLTSKSVSFSSDDHGTSYSETTDYEYDSHRQVVRTVRTCNGNKEETRLTYSGDMPDNQSVYGQMQAAGIFDRPIEKTILHDGKVVSSSLTTYRMFAGDFVPDRYYEARLDTPRSSWQKYNGAITSVQQEVYGLPKLSFEKYDRASNLCLSIGDDGKCNQYFWDYDGLYPLASFEGIPISVNAEQVDTFDSRKVDFDTISFWEYTFEFDADRAGPFTFTIEWPKGKRQGYAIKGYELTGVLDGRTVFAYKYVAGDAFQQTMTLYEGNVSAGHHTFRIYRPDEEKTMNLSGKGTISYPVYRTEERVLPLDVWFYGFEDESIHYAGPDRDMCWPGERTFSHPIPSGVPYTIDWLEMEAPNGVWKYHCAQFNGRITLGEGSYSIDNVRIYPSEAKATSWRWWIHTGSLQSVTDSNGMMESYEYDGMGRLVTVRDTDGNKKTSYEYWLASPAADQYNHIVDIGYNDESERGWRYTDRLIDGLGRPWQTVRICAGDIDADIRNSDLYDRTDYDDAGRPYRTWLPFRSNTIVPDHSERPSEPLYSDSEPFSLVEYDGLDRPRAEYGPGVNWHANGKAVRYGYYSNGTSQLLSYKTYSVTRPNMDNMRVSRGGVVAPGSLSVKSVTDEDGLTLLTFTDMYGRTLLERRHPVSGEDLDTYYVYDGLGRLSAVIPPALSKLDLSTENVDKYAYLYSYDANGNCIAKKLPGCGWIYYIYDKGNRLVFTQDAEYRKKGRWQFSFTDIHGRSCVTGYCEGSISSLRQAVSEQNVVAERHGNTSSPYMGYDVSGITLTNPVILSVSYYDDYGFIDSQVPSGLRAKMRYRTEFSLAKWDHVNGLLTGSAERVLGEDVTNDFMWSTCYYDRKGNLIQTHGTRADGGVDISTTEFTFTGNPKRILIRHSFGAQNAMDEYYTYTYDGWERPLTVKHRIGSDGVWTTVFNFKYDGIGRVKSDNRNGKAALRMNYTYNVRSWSKAITGPGLTEDLFYEDRGQWGGNIGAIRWSAGTGTEEFNDTYQYDGLSRLLSSHRYGSSKPNHKYINDYVYDLQGNMLQSSYRDENLINQRRVGGIVISELEGNATTKTFNYDGNRLISSSTLFSKYDRGYDLPTSVDSLAASFSYDRDGRIVLSDMDGMTEVRYNAVGHPSYVRLADGGYVQNKYTAGGARLESRRMEADGKLTSMAYEGNEVIENGKLRMLMFDGGYVDFSGDEPRYCWYTKDHLGSVRAVADAEGNVFASYAYGPYGEDFVAERTAASNVQEGVLGAQLADVPVYGGEITYVDQLRPGMTLSVTALSSAYSANESPDWQPYKFSGKESLTRVGLDLYDFGARMYSPSNMRWMTMDPLAEKYYSISPYAYCAGNPINFVDPTGMEIDEDSLKEWEELKRKIERERDRLQSKINKLNARAEAKGWSSEKLASKIGNKAERLASLNSSIETMGTLEGSDQVYSLSHTVNGENGGVTLNTSTNVIDIRFGGTANFVHEMTHAGQFESGDIAFSNNGMSYLQDVYDEVAAYKAQFGFSPSSVTGLSSTSVANSFDAITPAWVQGLKDASGNMPYAVRGPANTGLIPVNINSTKGDLIKAYPWVTGLNYLPANYNIKNTPGIYYK